MNITIYCGALTGGDPEFAKRAEELGKWMAENGHRLIYGGGIDGMMGVLSHALLEAGGEAVGIAPEFFVMNGETRTDLTEMVFADDMSQRRSVMIERGDAFMALPGGMGTIDEITEVMSLKRLGLLGEANKPVMIYNINGYYDSFFGFLDTMADKEFCRRVDRDNVIEVKCIEDIAHALEGAGREDKTRNRLYDNFR